LYSNALDDHPGFEVFLLIGTNIGQRERNLEKAISLISENAGEILLSSKIYESAAWGKENQNNFLNQVLKVHTFQGPWELLTILLEIENQMV
jgi:2-amino-4-hydroxy-6-hydroxymethyldihydropteridine diphosphokinase